MSNEEIKQYCDEVARHVKNGELDKARAVAEKLKNEPEYILAEMAIRNARNKELDNVLA